MRYLVIATLVAVALSLPGCNGSDSSNEMPELGKDSCCLESDNDAQPDVPTGETRLDVRVPEQTAEVGPAVHPWPTCPEWAAGGPTLAEKTAFLDELVVKQHLVDELLRTVTVDPETGEVTAAHHLPSTGLWTAIYLASQSLRYAVTGEEQAQENAGVAVKGLHHLTKVTGRPGLYGRCYHRPEQDYSYSVDGSPAWTASPVPEYEGWWFNNDVSKDTMDGIMFGYAVALEHLDDEGILTTIRDDVDGFVQPFVAEGLRIIDWNDVVTEHGHVNAGAMDDFPGFNALLSLSWIRTAMSAGSKGLDHFYYDCLLRFGDNSDCPKIDPVDLGSYLTVIEETLGVYRPDCQTSYDNIDMVFHAVYPLLRREDNEEIQERLRKVLDVGIWVPEDPGVAPSVAVSTHALYIFLYGGLASPSPENTVFAAAVNDAVCSLYRLPQDRTDQTLSQGQQEGVCLNRMGRPNAADIIPMEERYFDNYVWRLDPYEITEPHEGGVNLVHSPDDYLLAYWLGRYFGYITEEM